MSLFSASLQLFISQHNINVMRIRISFITTIILGIASNVLEKCSKINWNFHFKTNRKHIQVNNDQQKPLTHADLSL